MSRPSLQMADIPSGGLETQQEERRLVIPHFQRGSNAPEKAAAAPVGIVGINLNHSRTPDERDLGSWSS